MEDLLGYIAGTLTTLSFVPQAYKVIIEKNVEGLSVIMYLVFTIGVLCWLIYGILIANLPMLIFNIITLILSTFILYNILRYRKNA